MKKPAAYLLCFLMVLAVGITAGFYYLRNQPGDPVVLRHPQATVPVSQATQPTEPETTAPAPTDHFPVDINTATLEQLMTLPGIGQVYAQRILDYREAHGPFSSVTELLEIEGIGEKRLEKILDLIIAGG